MLVLASASPRRSALLTQLGVPHRVVPSEIDEARVAGEGFVEHAERLAREKARAVSGAVVEPALGADTVVLVGGVMLEKPRDDAEATRMIGRLAGREHEVVTCVALALRGEVLESFRSVTRVRFRPLDEETIRLYVAHGEGRDKAGAYGIQGAGGGLVESIEGDYGTIVGLPLAATLALLQRHGVVGAWP